MSTNDIDVLCDGCGNPVTSWFTAAYRKKELRNDRADPGNLCGNCAGSRDGQRIGAEIVAA